MSVEPATERKKELRNASNLKAQPFALRPRMIKALFVLVAVDAMVTAAAARSFGFTFDDLMNAYWGLKTSWATLALDALRIWRVSPVYRPVGVAILKLTRAAFGMNIAGWRFVYGLLFIAAIVLIVLLAQTISRSWFVALAAGLIMAFHPNLRWAYFSMGYVYDVGASILVSAFALCCLRLPERFGRTRVTLAVLFFWNALECKEAALAGLPFLFFYQLIIEEPLPFPTLRTRLKDLRLFLILLALSAAFCYGRITEPNSVIHLAPYQVDLSPARYLSNLKLWLIESALVSNGVIASLVIALVFTLAFIRSWRISVWCVSAFLTGILPVAFIPQRGLEALFVPFTALAILAGLALEEVCAKAAILFAHWTRGDHATAFNALAACGALAIFIAQGTIAKRVDDFPFFVAGGSIMPALQALEYYPSPGPKDHIVVESDPFGENNWSASFLFPLYFDAPDLEVRRRFNLPPTERDRVAPGWRHVRWTGLQWENVGPVELKP